MILLAPVLLLGLLALPALWWLVRATPPSPQEQTFPSLLILNRLTSRREDAARSPLWLLILRVLAVALVVFGLARPVLTPRQTATDAGPLTLVLDDGWASIPHWNERIAAALALGETTLRNGQSVTLLHTARSPDGAMPEAFTTHDTHALSEHLARLRPQPWPTDRQALAALLRPMDLSNQRVTILSDGLATDGDDILRQTLGKARSIQDMRWNACDLLRLAASTGQDGTLRAKVDTLPCPTRTLTLHAANANGGTLAAFPIRTGQEQTISLPPLLRNQLDHLTLDGTTGPAAVHLMGQADRRRPVGLLQTPGDTTPLVGSAFFLNRALQPIADLRSGDATALLGSPLSVLIATDGALSGDQTRKKVLDWVRHGGMLIRFAGPGLAADQSPDFEKQSDSTSDALLPVHLMSGMRQLGGPMSWGKPQTLAPFPETSPFSDLAIPSDVTVTRQVLAKPETGLADHVWAALGDGTPLVTARAEGNGEIVLFHVTASPDWSNVPLSGLFPDMLERLIERSAGVAGGSPSELAPWRILGSDGGLVMPPQAARSIRASDLGHVPVSVSHPAGLYGPARGTHALNLSDSAAPLKEEILLGTRVSPEGAQADRPLGPALMTAGLLLLLLDLLLSLRRRGLLGVLSVVCLLAFPAAQAQAPSQMPPLPATVPQAALETRLAYVVTGHDDVDSISREGLQGLSDFTTARSSATLGHPDGVIPGKDDLAFYPLLYWPITPDAQPDAERTKALNAFMEHGGILLIDEQGAGTDTDAGTSSAARAALQRVTDGLIVPPLAKLTDKHVLARTFYLLHSGFPGRVSGQPVYVARNGDEANDDVSPVIIGNGDWAHAWAVDSSGNHPFAVIPGGEDQRTQAYRFGMNMVLYALTGNYKNDQAQYPEMLRRLGNPSTDSTGAGVSPPGSDSVDEEDAP
ncbi:DUF4159 domain-containing protein [Gluconobacter kanchanaburiensis]|uniref:RNA-binding protein n=1 Tax=Gluconobacter kanchanaburiensis NBRC 103587 TaxID=1307948 RepID=A0A511B5Q7_9PROT|nr:DUF4159 domain-containing protein [Gluconobacter kanchanaburiensis]MBF0861405.1 DUF4159 domain-containing protein [Gluconobacter kanchanaburiensis]GBR68229.1 hypothetical protein AA103587_0696 [Gluconobacter kanchanaburiensis NBRC 103587]GEK95766.1 RNA-binding protein [Gluconobacter kanchanaburiensis NBRC 103587]